MEQREGKSKKKIIDGLSGMFQDKNEGPAEKPEKQEPAVRPAPPYPAPPPPSGAGIPEEPAPVSPAAADPAQEPVAKKRVFKPLPIILAAVIVLAAIGLGTAAWFKIQKLRAPGEKPVTLLMKPVNAAPHHQTLRFLVVSEQKNLVALDIDFNFINSAKYENFQQQMVEFRDAVYGFLLHQRPSAQDKASWQPLLEDGLLEHIKITQSRSRADWIHLHGVNVY